jgi:hypothetical protein
LIKDRSWVAVSYPIGSCHDEQFKKFELILSSKENEELTKTYEREIGENVQAKLDLEYYRVEPWAHEGKEEGCRICCINMYDAQGWLPTTASSHMLQLSCRPIESLIHAIKTNWEAIPAEFKKNSEDDL